MASEWLVYLVALLGLRTIEIVTIRSFIKLHVSYEIAIWFSFDRFAVDFYLVYPRY